MKLPKNVQYAFFNLCLIQPFDSSALPSPGSPGSNHPTVTLNAGRVVGTTTHVPYATPHVNKFLGIRYGDVVKRFSPAKPATAPRGDIVAQRWGPACVQFIDDGPSKMFQKQVFNHYVNEQSEDCLFLNVYTPSVPSPADGHPVMFFIHGGGFQYGSGGQPMFDGSAFAAYNHVIMVTINYRLGFFGYPGAIGLNEGEENPGLLDQHLALQWVQDNIQAFGGNPEKVTIFGESAGSLSVDALLTSYTNDAPFRAAILESGVYSYIGVPLTLPRSSPKPWLTVVSGMNCSASNSAEQNVTCLRSMPAHEIQRFIERNGMSADFWPVADDFTLFRQPAKRRSEGHFAKVPVMGGSNADEGLTFTLGQADFHAFLEQNFGSTVPSLIPEVKKAFPIGNVKGFDTAADRVAEIETLLFIQCPMALWSNESKAFGVPVWRYYLNASFPNQAIAGADLRVYHASELPLVFQTYSGGPINPTTDKPLGGAVFTNKPPTAQQYTLSRYMNAAWAAFAKNPQLGPGWNQYGTFEGNGTASLGDLGSGGDTIVKESELDAKCEVLKPLLRYYTGDVWGL